MILNKEDGKLYFELMLPLLQCIDCGVHINGQYDNWDRMPTYGQLYRIYDFLWDHVEMIDDYVDFRDDLTEEQREIILGWKSVIRSVFIVERHLKSGSIFIDIRTSDVYLVKGITSSFEEQFPNHPLPYVLEANLIPFKDSIITDGVFNVMKIRLGKNNKETAKAVYNNAKKSSTIIKQFTK